MNKNIINSKRDVIGIVVFIISILTTMTGSTLLYSYNSFDNEETIVAERSNKASSTYLVMEFDAKIMLNLDENGEVVEVFQLNDKAIKNTNDNLKKLNLNSAITKIIEINDNYFKEKKSMLISILDNGNNDFLEQAINNFKSNSIEAVKKILNKEEQNEILTIKENYVEPKEENKEAQKPKQDDKEDNVNKDKANNTKPKDNNDNKSNSDITKPDNNSKENNTKPNNNTEPAKPKPLPEKTFTATFNKNGATTIGATSLSCKTTGSSCTITSPSITKENYDIVGWSKSTSGTNPIKVAQKITLTENITYYAITKEAAYYIDAGDMLALINDERTKLELESLSISPSLTESAKIRAKEICQTFSHARPDGSSFSTINPLARGENIAGGTFYTDYTYPFTAWMNSQGHKENILRSSFNTVGIVGYYCPEGRLKYYWVQLFGY